jgi:HEAT repeat protein
LPQTSLFTPAFEEASGLEITQLEPSQAFENLPEHSVDEGFAPLMARLESGDLEERGRAVKSLAEYPVQSSVLALTSIARQDPEPSVRALAITSLAAINHQSVFSAVLLGLADESREVRAAAARSLNRLSFDRSEAYVRVIESSKEETLQEVAGACINAGIVSQNIDRLASSDHRQAYETFTLIYLLAKAGMTGPVLNAIATHASLKVRLTLVHLLAITSQPEVFEQLRALAISDGLSEKVKTAVLEAMYRLEQTKKTPEEAVEAFVILSSEQTDNEPTDDDDCGPDLPLTEVDEVK